jgi:hypothetical protein
LFDKLAEGRNLGERVLLRNNPTLIEDRIKLLNLRKDRNTRMIQKRNTKYALKPSVPEPENTHDNSPLFSKYTNGTIGIKMRKGISVKDNITRERQFEKRLLGGKSKRATRRNKNKHSSK